MRAVKLLTILTVFPISTIESFIVGGLSSCLAYGKHGVVNLFVLPGIARQCYSDIL